jgi:hypothetical protein
MKALQALQKIWMMIWKGFLINLCRTGILEGKVEATVTYQELAPQEVDEKGWPIGFLDHFYGICADDPIVLDDEGIAGIAEDLDDDMEGVFD